MVGSPQSRTSSMNVEHSKFLNEAVCSYCYFVYKDFSTFSINRFGCNLLIYLNF